MSTSKPGATAHADPTISIGDEVGIIGVHVVVPGVVEGRGYRRPLGHHLVCPTTVMTS